MARIETFIPKKLDRVTLHDPISADVICFERDGRKLLQINTSGRKSREMPGKISQSIQLDEKSAAQLFQMLKEHFGFQD
jgi:hypothetical protein